MDTPTIRNIRARPVMVPMKRPPVVATGTIREAPPVLLDLESVCQVAPRHSVSESSQEEGEP